MLDDGPPVVPGRNCSGDEDFTDLIRTEYVELRGEQRTSALAEMAAHGLI